MKLKRSYIDPKSKLFASSQHGVKFIDIDFPDGFSISLNQCKIVQFCNCSFKNLIVEGNFDSIYFDHCGGTVLSSKFSCNKININGSNGVILEFRQTIIENLKTITLHGNGNFGYINTLIPLTLESLDVSTSTFTIDSSKVIANFISFSEKSKFISYHLAGISDLTFKEPSILCDELLFDDSISDIHVPFAYNGIPMKHLKSTSRADLLKLAKLCELQTILKYLTNIKE
ncbi:MAG: hypothetical protein Q4D02_07685 [Clostridia bacterium]|nr:hypothetical protein [Clostridia bacterium]